MRPNGKFVLRQSKTGSEGSNEFRSVGLRHTQKYITVAGAEVFSFGLRQYDSIVSDSANTASSALFHLDDWFARELPELCQPWQASTAPAPVLLVLNTALAAELGIDADALRTHDGVAMLIGQQLVPGSRPVAQAYAGHQFGGYSPRLGDGRALLLGELIDPNGRRRDVHLKGSGRTPFARGGDGKAAIGPMLREYIISEAMHALGIPTTRSLTVVTTGEQISRDTMLPGAVLTRIAASHLRVGTFQYASGTGDAALVQRLADHAIARHYPHAADAPNPYLDMYTAVVEAQASLLAKWMLVGFVHGVMNTDNMTISGETIDYGPCAFMDRYNPAAVFSSIDHGGRYAFGNQPGIAQWNLARLAEAMLPLFAANTDDAIPLATEVLQSFTERFHAHWAAGIRAKLGLVEPLADATLVDDLLALLHVQAIDYTTFFRSLSKLVRGNGDPTRALFADANAFDDWAQRWSAAQATDSRSDEDVAAAMDCVNPIYIPRNHLVEAALEAAAAGDLGPFEQLIVVLAQPFDERPGLQTYASPGPAEGAPYRTFCGT